MMPLRAYKTRRSYAIRQFGLVVVRWSQSTKLLYTRPG